MTPDKPHLTLVDPAYTAEYEREFVPLPFYAWDERPPTLDLTQDECATAIYLAGGDLPAAASLLKVSPVRFNRFFRRSPALARIQSEVNELVVNRASAEYIRALDAPDDRRREWGATKIMQSRAAAHHPFAPAPPSNTASASLTLAAPGRSITFRWKTDDDPPTDDA